MITKHLTSSLLARWLAIALVFALTVALQPTLRAQNVPPAPVAQADLQPGPEFDPMSVLTAPDWQKVEQAVDRALAWLASQQQADGSFPTYPTGNPAVTSLCIMAFLARGHQPGEGVYGDPLLRAVRYVLDKQQPDGQFSIIRPGESLVASTKINHTASYNHAIAGIMLCEVYGLAPRTDSERIRLAIDRALSYTIGRQREPKPNVEDNGGWRYAIHCTEDNIDSDLSITTWHLMFLRAAKNAGFAVPAANIDQAVAYVKRCFQPSLGSFTYSAMHKQQVSRAMAGAGILALALSGLHDTPEARSAAEWIHAHSFDEYNVLTSTSTDLDLYHYGLYHCSLAMFQMGNRHWAQFYPRAAQVLLANQSAEGCWALESNPNVAPFGKTFTTALAALALSVPFQLLPIYQR